MSDPVSNHDIEDVLSSIRRLVAQGDPRNAAKPANEPTALKSEASASPSKQEPKKPVDRLVLTPAFRVNAPETTPDAAKALSATTAKASYDAAVKRPESDMIPTRDSRPMPAPSQSPSERASLEATIAELEAAVNRRTDEWEPDGTEVSGTDSFHAVFLNKLQPSPRRFEMEPEVEGDETEATLNHVVVDHIAETVAEEIAGAFPHLSAADEAPEEDAYDDYDVSDTVVPLNPEARQTSKPVLVRAISEETAPDVIDEDTVEIAFKGMRDLAPDNTPTQDVETVTETPTFRRSRILEVYDPIAEATADAAEAEPQGEDIYGDNLAPDPQDPGTAVSQPRGGTELVDPDMLRDMVSEMIRAELQGEMGERITRNVRKLVRREINRVISAQDFD